MKASFYMYMYMSLLKITRATCNAKVNFSLLIFTNLQMEYRHHWASTAAAHESQLGAELQLDKQVVQVSWVV